MSMNLTRRSLVTAVSAVLMVLVMALPAWAGDCVNLSRSAHQQGENLEVKGNWLYFDGFGWSFIPPGTTVDGFAGQGSAGSFHAGDGHALLEGSTACDSDTRQTEHGVQRVEIWVPC